MVTVCYKQRDVTLLNSAWFRTREFDMFKRFFVALLFAGFTLPALAATDYSDMWYIPAESGWGVNLTQNENVIFITFFIYGSDNQPKWYVAITARDANGNFTGSLFSTVGTYFGLPWNPADHLPATLVGTATFAPVNPYQGTLTYTLLGGPNVSKSIVRETLVAINLGGNYTGGQVGAYSECTDPALNGSYNDTYTVSVSQSNGSATLKFSYDLAGADCTLTGTVEQHGQLYRISSATYACTGGLTYSTTATIEELKATAQGIEGRIAALLPDTGCHESARFSAVLF